MKKDKKPLIEKALDVWYNSMNECIEVDEDKDGTYLYVEDVKEFIDDLKVSLRDKYSDKKCLYETAIITGKVFEEIDKLSGFNHSPSHQVLDDNHTRPQVGNNSTDASEVQRSLEDTSQICANCEHYVKLNKRMVCDLPTLEDGDCPWEVKSKDSCKKFTPKKEGCGVYYCVDCRVSNKSDGLFEHKEDCIMKSNGVIICVKDELCPKCKGVGE